MNVISEVGSTVFRWLYWYNEHDRTWDSLNTDLVHKPPATGKEQNDNFLEVFWGQVCPTSCFLARCKIPILSTNWNDMLDVERKHCKIERFINKSESWPYKLSWKEYSLSQKHWGQVWFHCRVQLFHADQWKLVLLDNQKQQCPGRGHSGLSSGEVRLTAPSQMYAVLIKDK